jgi:peptide/nickel transport system permease protein
MWQIIIVLGLLYGVGGSRIVRSAVIGIKENTYIAAADAIGATTPRILVRHILPNIMAPIIILFSTRVPTMILVEASLSFLGLGIPPPAPSWGGMLSIDGRRFMLQSPWLAVWPGLAFAIVVYGVNMFGDAIRDLLDPRLKGGVGRYS